MKSIFTRPIHSLQQNMLAGVITIGPLFVTYLVFSFLLEELAKAGLPIVHLLDEIFPGHLLGRPWLASIVAIVLTLAVLYIVGRLASLVIGKQVLNLFEAVLERLPLIDKVYGAVRQLIDTMMSKKEGSQRVVLVDFPIPGQKCIGFLTRTMDDTTNGTPMGAVLVPNAINPTSAFLQILPLSRISETNLTMEQAMSMLLTGGSVGPDTIHIAPFPAANESSLPSSTS